MSKVVIIGGGWAGVSAAVTAKNAGGDVLLLERTEMLLGTGLVGGIMRNNGRFTATEENIAMGANEIFETVDATCRHTNIEFPGHKHASLYDIALIETAIKNLLLKKGIEIKFQARAKDVKLDGKRLQAVVLDNGEVVEGDVFIEATGSAGPMNNCIKYGNGCVMCVLRCPTFGGRVSIAEKMGIQEKIGQKDGAMGAMSGSGKLLKESLAKEIVETLDRTGVAVIPVPKDMEKKEGALAKKACQQYALPAYAENIILLDTGHAKIMTPYYPLEELRRVPGFENARYEDPYSGGIGNSMRFLALSPRDNALQVEGAENLFCCGEKAGLLVGHTEAIVTGSLAGYNAVRFAMGVAPLVLPESLAIGDAIAHVKEQMNTEEGLGLKFTFSGSVYFQRMQEKGLYVADKDEVKARVEAAGMTGIFRKPIAN